MQLKWTVTLLALAAGPALALAAEPTLKVGSPAPKLQTGKWVQGEPVKQFEPGKAYLVEFWATWCGPCRVSIPHLNDIYTKYKDKGLIVIGQDCWEEDEKLVAPFVEQMGEKMTYRVALDDKETSKKGRMAETWMDAAGQNGIPTAFLVDTKGVIAWIGHPMKLKEQVIEDVLAGTFDVPKAAAEAAQLIAARSALSLAMQNQDWDGATARLAELEKLLPEDQRGSLHDGKLFAILIGKEDYPAAYKVAAKISETHKDDAMWQNSLAWQIATDKTIKQRDLVLAETIATRANAAAKGAVPNVLDTLARVLFMEGKQAEAIQQEEKAVTLAKSVLYFQKVLDSYKKGELPDEN